jgi:serine/threonine protein kinase
MSCNRIVGEVPWLPTQGTIWGENTEDRLRVDLKETLNAIRTKHALKDKNAAVSERTIVYDEETGMLKEREDCASSNTSPESNRIFGNEDCLHPSKEYGRAESDTHDDHTVVSEELVQASEYSDQIQCDMWALLNSMPVKTIAKLVPNKTYTELTKMHVNDSVATLHTSSNRAAFGNEDITDRYNESVAQDSGGPDQHAIVRAEFVRPTEYPDPLLWEEWRQFHHEPTEKIEKSASKIPQSVPSQIPTGYFNATLEMFPDHVVKTQAMTPAAVREAIVCNLRYKDRLQEESSGRLNCYWISPVPCISVATTKSDIRLKLPRYTMNLHEYLCTIWADSKVDHAIRWDAFSTIINSVARTLHTLHTKYGLIHGDVRPENVMLLLKSETIVQANIPGRPSLTYFETPTYALLPCAVALTDVGLSFAILPTMKRAWRPGVVQSMNFRAPELCSSNQASGMEAAHDIWALCSLAACFFRPSYPKEQGDGLESFLALSQDNMQIGTIRDYMSDLCKTVRDNCAAMMSVRIWGQQELSAERRQYYVYTMQSLLTNGWAIRPSDRCDALSIATTFALSTQTDTTETLVVVTDDGLIDPPLHATVEDNMYASGRRGSAVLRNASDQYKVSYTQQKNDAHDHRRITHGYTDRYGKKHTRPDHKVGDYRSRSRRRRPSNERTSDTNYRHRHRSRSPHNERSSATHKRAPTTEPPSDRGVALENQIVISGRQNLSLLTPSMAWCAGMQSVRSVSKFLKWILEAEGVGRGIKSASFANPNAQWRNQIARRMPYGIPSDDVSWEGTVACICSGIYRVRISLGIRTHSPMLNSNSM